MKTLAFLLALLTCAPALAEPALVFSFITEKIEFGPGDLVEAEAGISHSEPFPAINFRMSAAKAAEFEAMSGRHVGDPMDILVCGRLISSPVIREPIRGGSGQINGQFTPDEALELAARLRTGACAGV
jgi:SecD/SecF fusion protein